VKGIEENATQETDKLLCVRWLSWLAMILPPNLNASHLTGGLIGLQLRACDEGLLRPRVPRAERISEGGKVEFPINGLRILTSPHCM